MAFIIEDGTGSGKKAAVSAENFLLTEAVTIDGAHHTNEVHAKAWSLPTDGTDPTTTDDYFMYIKNTGTVDLDCIKFTFSSTVAGIMEIHTVTGTAGGVTNTVVPVNMKVGNSTVPTATILDSVDITGLTSTGVLHFMTLNLNTTAVQEVWDPDPYVILPPGQAIALLWDTSSGALSGTIEIIEETE